MILNIVAYQKKPFSATVVVTCPSGTTSCTLTKSGSTATQTAHSGNTYTFSVNGDAAKGSWTATASNGSKTTTSSVNAQTDGGSYSVTLPAYPVDPTPPDPQPTVTKLTVVSSQSAWNIMSDDYPAWTEEQGTVKGYGTYEFELPGPGTYTLWGINSLQIYATVTMSQGETKTVNI